MYNVVYYKIYITYIILQKLLTKKCMRLNNIFSLLIKFLLVLKLTQIFQIIVDKISLTIVMIKFISPISMNYHCPF